MSREAQQEALSSIQGCLSSHARGLISTGELFLIVCEHLDDALLSPPDPFDDFDALVEVADRYLAQISTGFGDFLPPGISRVPPEQALREHLAHLLPRRQASDQLLGAVVDWKASPPTDAVRPVRRQAVQQCLDALPFAPRLWLLERAVVAGARALGPAFLRDLAIGLMAQLETTTESRWMATRALDELAAWAASTDPGLTIPGERVTLESRSVRARRMLVELAGVDYCSALALSRLPFHRLDPRDRSDLNDLMMQRSEFYPESWVEESDEWVTRGAHMAFLLALDAAESLRSIAR